MTPKSALPQERTQKSEEIRHWDAIDEVYCPASVESCESPVAEIIDELDDRDGNLLH